MSPPADRGRSRPRRARPPSRGWRSGSMRLYPGPDPSVRTQLPSRRKRAWSSRNPRRRVRSIHIRDDDIERVRPIPVALPEDHPFAKHRGGVRERTRRQGRGAARSRPHLERARGSQPVAAVRPHEDHAAVDLNDGARVGQCSDPSRWSAADGRGIEAPARGRVGGRRRSGLGRS